jgi:hypothetical protein
MSIPFGVKVIGVFLDDALNSLYLPFTEAAIVSKFNHVNPKLGFLIVAPDVNMLTFTTIVRPKVKPVRAFNEHRWHDVE